MESARIHPLPARDPVSGGDLVVTEVQGVETGITIRGRFEMPRFARLSAEQAHYLETFLRCRGMLNSVERELGISYPTARARLDSVLRALDLFPAREDGVATPVADPEVSSEVEGYAEAEFDGAASPNDSISDEAFRAEPQNADRDGEATRLSRNEILDLLERGEITPERAKSLMGAKK